MSRVHVGHEEADDIVRARLGRPAQDVLEAAVVLEAWGGVPTVAALRLGAGILPRHAPPHAPGRSRRSAEADPRESVLAEGVALLMAILAIAAWAGPLSEQLGAAAFEHALLVALPTTLALQWALRSRYLSRRAGLRWLAADAVPLCLVALALEAALVLLPHAGALTALLVAIWVGGTVLARRGWGLGHGVLLSAGAVALTAGVSALASLGALALATVLAAAVAVRTAPRSPVEPPGPLRRAIAAAAIGGLLGGLLVGDPSLGWGVHGAFPALALVPSVIGSVWGGYHLWRLHDEVPRRLLGVPLARSGDGVSRRAATDVALGALVRLVGSTVALSALTLASGRWTHGTDAVSVFLAFGCVALACLLVSLLDSLGHLRWALFSAACGLAVELAVCRFAGGAPPGAGLIAGALIAGALALAPLLGLLRSASRVLATALWIR